MTDSHHQLTAMTDVHNRIKQIGAGHIFGGDGNKNLLIYLSLPKLVLQMCMPSHPVGLDVWFLVRPFVYFHALCVRTAKALARLRGCAGSPEPSLVAHVISTIISWAGSIAPRQRQTIHYIHTIYVFHTCCTYSEDHLKRVKEQKHN